MLITIFVIIVLISFWDLRTLIHRKNTNDLVFYMVTALLSLLYCYYYTTHELSASSINLILKLMGMQ